MDPAMVRTLPLSLPSPPVRGERVRGRGEAALALSIILLLAAHSVPGSAAPLKPSLLPLGLYAVADPAALAPIHHAGFNAIVPAAPDAEALHRLADACAMEGLALLMPPPFTQTLSGHPTAEHAAVEGPVLAWYLADEPDVTGMTEDQLVALDQRTKKAFPGPPTAFVVGDGGDALCYAKAADILMVDWYPVPHRPLTSVGDHVRWTVDAAKGRPVWAMIQAYDWRDQAQRNPNVPRIGRFPTTGEIRFMSYLALARGAQGLFYFQFAKPGGKTLLDFPDQWYALTLVVHELSQLASVMARGVSLPAKPGSIPGLTARAWRDAGAGEEVLVLVNESEDRAATVPPILRQDRWAPLGNNAAPGELVAPLSVSVLRRSKPATPAKGP